MPSSGSASRRSTRCSSTPRPWPLQLSGLVNDDQSSLNPALAALNQVTTLLQNDQANLAQALALAGPYYRLLGNALGNGRWFDVYLCGLIPHSVAPGNTPAHGCEPPKP